MSGIRVKIKLTEDQLMLFESLGHKIPKDDGSGYYYFLPFWIDSDGFVSSLDKPLPSDLKRIIESERERTNAKP